MTWMYEIITPGWCHPYVVKEEIKFFRALPDDEWKIPIVKELIEARNGLDLSDIR